MNPKAYFPFPWPFSLAKREGVLRAVRVQLESFREGAVLPGAPLGLSPETTATGLPPTEERDRGTQGADGQSCPKAVQERWLAA